MLHAIPKLFVHIDIVRESAAVVVVNDDVEIFAASLCRRLLEALKLLLAKLRCKTSRI